MKCNHKWEDFDNVLLVQGYKFGEVIIKRGNRDASHGLVDHWDTDVYATCLSCGQKVSFHPWVPKDVDDFFINFPGSCSGCRLRYMIIVDRDALGVELLLERVGWRDE